MFVLILALCLRYEGVYDLFEGVPVLLREGQLIGLEAHIVETARHGVLIFQQGGGILRDRGIHIESLAMIDSLDNCRIHIRD